VEISIRFSWENVRQLFFWLIGFELFLLVAYLLESVLGSPVWTIERLLDLDGELSIAVWFSTVQLAAIGILFLIKAAKARPNDQVPRWFLALGCAGFLFLSLDEHLQLHETITKLTVHLDWVPRFSGDHGVWIFAYLGLGCLLLLPSLRPIVALWRFHRYSFSLMAAGVGVFLLGAVGMEVIGYEFLREAPRLYQVLEIATEEFLEMLGASAILCGAAFYALEAEAVRAAVTEDIQQPELTAAVGTAS